MKNEERINKKVWRICVCSFVVMLGTLGYVLTGITISVYWTSGFGYALLFAGGALPLYLAIVSYWWLWCVDLRNATIDKQVERFR